MTTQWLNAQVESLSLDGAWTFALADQHGIFQAPGVWETQEFDRQLDGPAIFERTILIPAHWQGQRIQLQFDAVSYHVEAQVNSVPVGTHTGLWSSFAFDVTDAIQAGAENLIRLTVYKPGERFSMRESLAGFLPDVRTTFGGIWQPARLVAFDGPALSELSLLADARTGEVRLSGRLHEADGLMTRVRIQNSHGATVADVQAARNGDGFDARSVVARPDRWGPDHPILYTATLTLETAEGVVRASTSRRFGFRELWRQGELLNLNDQPICLRGALNWGWYPEILCPAPDEATIREEFRRVRAMGYNMIKLCLYVPSARYFEIADEEGMLLWLELPMWLPEVTPRLRQQAPIEYAEILGAVHHHPSIVIYSLGCELDASADADLLEPLNALLRVQTCGSLACDNSGSGEAYGGLSSDYADFNDYHFYCDLHYFNPLIDHFSRDWREPRPWIFGEFCDADDYRDLDDLMAAWGGALPWWLTEKNPIHPLSKLAYPEQQARLRQLGLEVDGQTLQRISRQQSFMIRKTILEKVRSRAGMGGYVVTGLRDTPLATSSMYDDLGRPKYDPEAFRVFNADTVLTLEQGRARLWQRGGDRPYPRDLYNHQAGNRASFRLVVSHAGLPLAAELVRWRLRGPEGTVHASGEQAVLSPLAGGNPQEIASITFTFPEVGQPQKFTLRAELGDQVHNEWSLWAYPPEREWTGPLALYDPAGTLGGLDDVLSAAHPVTNGAFPPAPAVVIAGTFTPELRAHVASGGRAIVLQSGAGTLPVQPCPFWREAIKLLYPHPILDSFPHDGYADLQFYHLATDFALDTARFLEELPEGGRISPILRRLDARLFNLLDYLIEVELGEGRMLVSTLHFGGGAGDQVTGLKASIAGRFLLDRMIRHLRVGPG